MKILCPTDFSDHSIKALEYAMNLANAIDAEVHVLSTFTVVKSSASFVSMEGVIRQNHEEDMNKLLAGLGTLIKQDKVPTTKVVKGDPVSTILRYVNHFDIDLIVMGTQGGNSMRTTLFGSTTKKVAAKTKIPVLAIPEEIKHRLTSNKILLALDDKAIDNEAAFQVPIRIAKALDLQIDTLHIYEEDELIPIDPSISIILDDRMGEVHLEKGKDAVLSIKNFVEMHNIGLLIMIRRPKNFLQKLLTIGNTSEELSRTDIPLMILPG